MKKNMKPTTKIIAGKYKGKMLLLPTLDITRSSKSILKESFFNVLQFDVAGCIFIEAFGGSGSIGLEAISRGANEVYFCEKDENSYRILQQNCQIIQQESCITILGDTFEKFPILVQSLINKKEDIIVYIDPPFNFRDRMENIYKETYDLVKNIKNENIILIVFEHITTLTLPAILGKFTQFKNKKFGKSSLTYYHV
jgi:16S rRNA (guanine(966)-N(2))-methyltransferase RsmD